MKHTLLRLLACPTCGHANLRLDAFRVDETRSPVEVIDGLLRCVVCPAMYPVAGGIPRMLPDSCQEYGQHLVQYGVEIRPSRNGAVRDFARAHRASRESFSFEWLRYEVPDKAETTKFFQRATGFTAEQLHGKLVLDAGCGMGRHTEVAASWGAEVVGIDLSRSVERAQAQTQYLSGVHFIQGNLMKPPLRPEAFDVIYSLGVLHHTPDTRSAFRSILCLLAPGGAVAIWVYRTFQPQRPVALHKHLFSTMEQAVSDGLRVLTTRLPHLLLHYCCCAAVPVGALKGIAARNPLAKCLLWPTLLLPISGHPNWKVRLCDTFDWLSPRYQWKHTTAEVIEWFQAEGLQNLHCSELEVSVAGVKPLAVFRREERTVPNAAEQHVPERSAAPVAGD